MYNFKLVEIEIKYRLEAVDMTKIMPSMMGRKMLEKKRKKGELKIERE